MTSPPASFLHRIDPRLRRFELVRTSRRRLSDAPFLDGRVCFWDGEAEPRDFASPLPGDQSGAAEPERYIFHVSFCGSTLLASLLGDACHALVLKEPHCLVDLADWKKSLRNQGLVDADFEAVARAARRSLFQRWQPGEPVVVKASNWPNNLLSDWVAGAEPACTFITMAPVAFLTAVLRGGQQRLAFTARVAAHLASEFEDGDAIVNCAIRSAAGPLGQAVNLAALAHLLQLRLFDHAADRLDPGSVHRLDFADITADLEGAARKAARALRLELDEDRLPGAVAVWAGKDPKQPGTAFSRTAHDRANIETERLHTAAIDQALRWRDGLPALILRRF